MQSQEVLNQIASLLIAHEVEFLPIENATNPSLLVYMGNDYKNRDRELFLFAQNQSLVNVFGKTAQKKTNYNRVQFQILLPFPVRNEAVFEVASLLHLINHMIELPGFELDELNNQISYRYVLLTGRPEDTPALYISILGIILMTLDLFTEVIEKMASGDSTFNQLLEEIVRLSQKIGSHD